MAALQGLTFGAVTLAPEAPLWDNIFDYYLPDPSPGTAKTVVEPTASKRLISGAIETVSIVTGGYTAMPFEKWPRQGAYDSVHIAPKMTAGHPTVAPDPITMAPFCVHDCFHLHWRWGGMWSRPGLIVPNGRELHGWNALGQPHTEPGAPMVPVNQRVSVAIGTPSTVRYHADIDGVQAGTWQIVMHHGGAYGVGHIATTAITRLVEVVKIAMPLIGGLLPSTTSNWGLREWATFYGLLRWHPSLSGPKERIHLLDGPKAES